MGALERTLEEDAVRGGSVSDRRSSFDAFPEADEDEENEPEGAEDERDLRVTPDGYLDAAYDEDADDDLMDLGFRMGKVRITERIGGYVHPKLVEEINTHLEYASKSTTSANSPNIPSQEASYLKIGEDYVAPASNFFFAPHPPRNNLIDFLPSKIAADKLVTHYWNAVHCLARIVHRPSFQRQYDYFWQSLASGFEPPLSQQAAVFAAMFSSAMSMTDDAVMQGFGVSKPSLVDNLRMGTETALSKANFLKTTKLETIQALVMYLLPQCRGEVSRAHSALTGTAIRLAECMGLHRDGSQYGLCPVEIHVRRLIWYQLCFLDVRTCEATGPRPQIAEEHFDTQLPLNVNDSDLESPLFKGEESPNWTDMTLTRIRFECNRIHRLIWFERPRVDNRQMTLTALLSKVEKFRRDMEKYNGMFDETVPIQHFTKLVMSSLIVKAHIMILARYRRSDIAPSYPERLRQLTLSAAIIQAESSVALETSPSFKLWWWYTGAFQQYHVAILLLMELYETPEMPESGRIWACLDYIFETAPNMSGREKAKALLLELSDRSRIYNSRRKLKAPVTDPYEQRRLSAATARAARQAAMPPTDLERRPSSPSSRTSPTRLGAAGPSLQESHSSIFGMYTIPRTSPGGMTRAEFNFNTASRESTERRNSSQPEFSMPLQTHLPYNLPGIPSSHHAPTASQFTPQTPASSNQIPGAGNINDVMADIDWNEWDALFPAGSSTDWMNVPNFGFGADTFKSAQS